MTTGRINQVTIIKWKKFLTTQRPTLVKERIAFRKELISLTSSSPKTSQCEFMILIMWGKNSPSHPPFLSCSEIEVVVQKNER